MPHKKQKHHHLQQLRRRQKKLKPFDYVIYFFTFATPMFEIPQAITIYTKHSARDVSLWTWGFFVIDNLVWIVYSWRAKLRPLLISTVLYLIIELTVVIGIIKYS